MLAQPLITLTHFCRTAALVEVEQGVLLEIPVSKIFLLTIAPAEAYCAVGVKANHALPAMTII